MAAGPLPGTSPFAGHPPQGGDADTAVRHARSTQTGATARHRTGVFTNVRDHFHGPGRYRAARGIRRLRGQRGPGHHDAASRAARSGCPPRTSASDRRLATRADRCTHGGAAIRGVTDAADHDYRACPRVASTCLGFPPVSVRARHVPVRAAASPVGVASRSTGSACARSSASSGSSPASDRGPVDCGQRVRLHGPWGQPEVAAACAVHQSAGSISP